MWPILVCLALLLATPAAAQLQAGIAGVAPKAAVHLNGRTVLGFRAGPMELRGTELTTAAFPTGHSIAFTSTGSPNVTVDACAPTPCTSGDAEIQEWTNAKVVFKTIPPGIQGGYTVAVTTPLGTSNGLPVEVYATTNYLLPAPNDDNLTSVSRLLVDGFEYGCDGGEPCSLAGTEFSHTQWTFADLSGTPQNDYSATPWNGDAGNNWALHVDAQEYVSKTIASTTDVSIHFEFCPQATPAAERTIMDFRTAAAAVQGYLTFGTDNRLHSYYATTGNVGPASSELTNGTCYEIALLQDASLPAANCAQLTLYVDGQAVGDSQLCSLTIGGVERVRLGAISGAGDFAFDNVVISGGYDVSVAYLRLADLHPDADSSPNTWTRTNFRSGCTSGANYQCVNDLVPNGQCEADGLLACTTGLDCPVPVVDKCKYTDLTPLQSVDIADEGALVSTTTPTNREEFSLTDLTLDDNPVEKFATGSAVGLTCWMQAVNAATDVCYTLTDGTSTTCAGATAVTDASYSPVTQLSTPGGVPTVCIGGTEDGNACAATTDCVDADGVIDGACGTDNALHFLLQSPSSTANETRVRATACVAEVEITKRLPSYLGSNPLPVAMDFDAAGNLWASAEYSNKLFKLPTGAADGSLLQSVEIPTSADGPFVLCIGPSCGAGQIVSTTAEDVDYRDDSGTTEIWLSQGGAWLYGSYVFPFPGGVESTNVSRVLRYRPSGSPTWQCYPIPTNNEQIFSFVVESNSSLWVAGRTAVWHTDPSAWTAAQKSCTTIGDGAPLCGSSPCWTAYALPTPVSSPYGADDQFGGLYGMELVGSNLWLSRYLSNELLKFNTSSHAFTQYALPTLAITQRLFTDYVGHAYPDLGNGPQAGVSDGTYIWWPLWYGNTIARQAISDGSITTYPIPDITWEKPHTPALNGTEVWTATQDEDTISTVWTGTETDGTITSGQTCAYWTVTGSGSGGSYGAITATDATWTENTGTCGTVFDANRRALYCIEQGTGAGKRIFYTSRNYYSNFGGPGANGLAGADALCQGRADTMNFVAPTQTPGGPTATPGPPPHPTWKAWLSDGATSAASRLTHNSGSYVLVNGTKVADNWDDLVDGTLTHAIDVSEEGNSGGGRFTRLDAAVSPLAVEALPPISAISSSYRSGSAGLASDPTNPFRICSSLGGITGTKSIMRLEKQPPPATFTVTATPQSTATATQTPTPVLYENGVLHGLAVADTVTAARYFQSNVTSTSIEAAVEVTTPFGIQFNRTDILCAAGPGGSRVATFQQRRNRGDVSGGSCTITGSPSPATCNMSGLTQDYTISGLNGDEFDVRHTRSATGGSAAVCTTATAYSAVGGVGQADAILSGGGMAVSIPASATRYCGSTWGNLTTAPNNAWSCGGTATTNAIAAANAAILIPAPCTLSGFGMRLESALPASVTETLTVKVRPKASAPTSAAGDLTTNLSQSLSSSSSGAVDTTCSSNCSVVAGDRVFIEDVAGAGGTPAARMRRWSLSCDGTSTQTGGLVSFTLANSLGAAAHAYGLYNTNSAVSSVAARAPRAIVARSLYVLIDDFDGSTNVASAAEQKVTLRKHATDPTQLSSATTDTALTCTTAVGTSSGSTWCTSPAHCCKLDGTDVSIAQGDYYAVDVTATSGNAASSAFVHVAFEESSGN